MPTLGKFVKYHGGGNDFILIEDFDRAFPTHLVTHFCHRQMGIGADGLILVRKSKHADYAMVYHNADGSEAFCGNGLRCFVHFLRDLGYLQEYYQIEACGNVFSAQVRGENIFTFLPRPKKMKEYVLHDAKIFVVDTGTSHAVIFSNLQTASDSFEEKVFAPSKNQDLAKKIRHHEIFSPNGINVNFVEKRKDQLHLRTYEKGVEGETLACGTGAAAIAFVAHTLGLCEKKVEVVTKSQSVFTIAIGDVIEILGPSKKVFEGMIEIDAPVFQK